MFNLSQTDRIGQSLDAAAIAAADLSLDAAAGADLCADLDEKWFDQGRALFLEGQPLDACWNEMQRAGYLLAESISSDPIAVEDWPRIHRSTARAMAAVGQLVTVTVDGAELALFPWEDAEQVAEEMAAFWDEVERRPWLGDDEPVSDPALALWHADGCPVGGFTWDGDYSDILPADQREDWIGM